MIIENSLSKWDYAILILNAGHAEYTLAVPSNPTGYVRCFPIHDPYEDVINRKLPALIKQANTTPGYEDLWYDSDLWEFGVLYKVQGCIKDLTLMYEDLVESLMNPSGDDDVFDYWPSGMRMAYEFALDLTNLDNNEHYMSRYRDILNAWIDHNLEQAKEDKYFDWLDPEPIGLRAALSARGIKVA